MSDTDPAPTPDPDSTPGSADLAPELASEPVVAQVAVCPICGHAGAAHASGRCLVMRGDFGTGGPCPCPDVPA